MIPDTSESLVKMASALQPPRLAIAVKKNSGGAGWKYFAYEADDQGRAKDRPVRKQCYKAVLTKRGGKSNSSKLQYCKTQI